MHQEIESTTQEHIGGNKPIQQLNKKLLQTAGVMQMRAYQSQEGSDAKVRDSSKDSRDSTYMHNHGIMSQGSIGSRDPD